MDWRGSGVAAGHSLWSGNGFVIAKLKINALITTLATIRLFEVWRTSFQTVKRSVSKRKLLCPWLRQLVRSACANLATVACLIIFGLLLNKTTFGRKPWRLAGTKRLRVWRVYRLFDQNYYLCSLWPGISDSRNYSASRMTSGQPMTSIGYELIVIPPAF